MATVFNLLTLPKTSGGLSEIRSTVIDSVDSGSASPRRKVPRLDTDSDSASASRSKPTKAPSGPITITIRGDFAPRLQDNSRAFALVRQCIRIILTRDNPEFLPSSYEHIYSSCRAIVGASGGEGLYDALKMELEQSIGRLANSLISTPNTGIEWITFFVDACDWFGTHIDKLQSLLTYLDQGYAARDPKVASVRELAFSQFSNRIFDDRRIVEYLRSGISEWLSWERKNNSEHKDRDRIKLLIKHLLTHQQYSPIEEYYLEITRAFYMAESNERAKNMKNDPKGFYQFVSRRIKQEDARCKDVLPVGSWVLVRKVTEKALWTGRLEWLANETLGAYMDDKDITELEKMYTLFARVDGAKILCAAFRKHIRTSVENIVKDSAHDEDMVQRLLDLKALADTTIVSAFLDEATAIPDKSNNTNDNKASTSIPLPRVPNQEFTYALSDAFTTGFKARRNKPAEMIAKYLDKAMRKGQGTTTDSEFEALLDSVLALYRFTEDKDVFRTFYHRSLAKRLLLEKSASNDFEAAMLKKLKEQYDPEFGMAEDMFKDLALSREAMREYHAKKAVASPARILTAMVLQQSAWPFTAPNSSITLPENMQDELDNYKAYYKFKHTAHRLTWDHALGTATLTARFKAGIKELSVSLYQAVILLLFNDEDTIPFKYIKEATNMEDGELRRTLQSLACGKKKVLKKLPPGKDVNDEDIFKFNDDFDDPRAKVHINSIQAKVSPEESKRTNISIEGDRKHYIDAAIVRIMKAKKEMGYEQLKAATIDAVKNHFVPQVDIIKKRIDSLVESDYLERSEEDRSIFHYVA
ncbi:Cullin-4B [Crucibulum laeve]|uniref:Cullin-4B n=1 Tax=Crucibulum laeve TaxID=68775 RepID=A0A5C3M0Q1_9AGAR|nr:Cullin-4B [Crucibulum laeve]